MAKITASKMVKVLNKSSDDSKLKQVFLKLKKNGIKAVDFSTLNPKNSTPGIVRNYVKRAIDKRRNHGYPEIDGHDEFKKTVANWIFTRFDVEVDAKKEICATLGMKEAIFNFSQAFIDEGDYVIIPNPSNPDLEISALLAGAEIYNVPLNNDFLINFDCIPDEIAKKAKVLWLNYPNNPTSAMANIEFYHEAVQFCQKNNIILASDENHSEIYFNEKPVSVLQAGVKNVIVFNSLSTRSTLAMYRVGYVAGDNKIIEIFKKLQRNVGHGPPTFVQDGAIAAYSDENHVEAIRGEYKSKMKNICEALTKSQIEFVEPKASPFIWVKCPNLSSDEFVEKLLDEISVLTSPGYMFGSNGEGYVRLALSPEVDDCKLVAERLSKLKVEK